MICSWTLHRTRTMSLPNTYTRWRHWARFFSSILPLQKFCNYCIIVVRVCLKINAFVSFSGGGDVTALMHTPSNYFKMQATQNSGLYTSVKQTELTRAVLSKARSSEMMSYWNVCGYEYQIIPAYWLDAMTALNGNYPCLIRVTLIRITYSTEQIVPRTEYLVVITCAGLCIKHYDMNVLPAE